MSTRLPLSINLSVPALIFLAGAASGFTMPEILGANLFAGFVAVLLSILRLNDAVARVLPPQIVIGVFAGSILGFLWKTSGLAMADPVASGPAVVGFVLVLLLTRNQLAAVGAAAATGFAGILIGDGVPDAGSSIALPQISLPSIAFDPLRDRRAGDSASFPHRGDG